MLTVTHPVARRHIPATPRHQGPAYHKTLVRSGYAPVNGLQMYYEIHGTVAARPLLTIHPWLGLAGVFPSLVRNRQLIAVELQGHGRTADIERPMTIRQHADDIAALLEHLRIPQADFFGESFGGTIAVQMAISHPERVRRVAIYGSLLGKLEEVISPEIMAQFLSLTPDHPSIAFERDNYLRVAPDPSQWETLVTKSKNVDWRGFSRGELQPINPPTLLPPLPHA